MTIPLKIVQRGRQDYDLVWREMQAFVADRPTSAGDEIWLVEHPPVFTLGQNGSKDHVLAAGDIPLIEVDRGGQVTYHGPGQLVIYPLVHLPRLGLGVRELVCALEQSVIELCAHYDIRAIGRRDAPGVYVDDAKVASVGLRIRRGWCFHGMSVNVAMDLAPFGRINPCGYAGLLVNQLSALGGPRSVTQASEQLLPILLAKLGYNDTTIATHTEIRDTA